MTDNNLKSNCVTGTSLPTKIPYRHYFCLECKTSIAICVCCDRGHIYCAPCSKTCKLKRIKKARHKYIKSPQGIEKRKAQCKRRYKRKETERKKLFQGDQGSLYKAETLSEPLPALLRAEGVVSEASVIDRDEKAPLQSVEQSGKHQVVCAFCGKECAPYQRPPGPWRNLQKRWNKNTLYSNGGFTR